MKIKKDKLTLLRKIPWLYLMIITIWLVVLGVMANRYFNFQKDAGKNQQQEAYIIDGSDNGESLAYKLNFTNSTLEDSQIAPNNRETTLLDAKDNHQEINLANKVLYTSLGELQAVYDANTELYTLFFNQLPLSQVANPKVIYAFQLINKRIVIIFDANIVGGDPIYAILDLSPQNKLLIHEVGNYERLINADLDKPGNCVHLKFEDARKYVEAGDYQLYQYCGTGTVYKILDVKSENYYQQKFSQYTTYQIVEKINKDHCFDTSGKNFLMTRACNYGIKYCYMFNSIQKPKRDKYYTLLQNACTNASNVNVVSNINLN